MKLLLMPRQPTWWIWLLTALLLLAGLTVNPAFLVGALVVSFAQGIYFLWRHRSFAPYSVQIRVAYTSLLTVGFVPVMRWLYWLPTLGTFALVLFGYCLMARVLSLLPWNRRRPLTLALVRQTFLTPPAPGNPAHGLLDSGCAGNVCELEARIALR